MAITSREFIVRQLTLECLRINESGYLQAFPCVNPDQPPRVACFRTTDGQDHLFFHQDLPPLLRQHLKLLLTSTFFEQTAQIQRTLSEDAPCDGIFIGQTYHFPLDALAQPFDDREIVYRDGGSVCAIMNEGEIVASCSSVREDAHAAEAWVHTEDSYRECGLGRRVTLAWARRVAQAGKTPFYSFAMSNNASHRLVAGLPFHHLYDVVTYT